MGSRKLYTRYTQNQVSQYLQNQVPHTLETMYHVTQARNHAVPLFICVYITSKSEPALSIATYFGFGIDQTAQMRWYYIRSSCNVNRARDAVSQTPITRAPMKVQLHHSENRSCGLSWYDRWRCSDMLSLNAAWRKHTHSACLGIQLVWPTFVLELKGRHWFNCNRN